MDQILLRTTGNLGGSKPLSYGLMRYRGLWEEKASRSTDVFNILYRALSFKAQYRKVQTYKIGK